jgi:cell division transport system permease protein
MSLASILSVVSALVIVGIIFIVAINVNYLTEQVEDNLELKVYLESDATDLQKDAIYSALLSNVNVSSITYESKEEAMANFESELEGYDYLLEGYTDDNIPLPDSYIVKLSDPSKIDEVSDYISDFEGVRDVVYGKETVDKLLQFNKFITTISWVIFSILSLIAVFIIYNTIKLTVFSRRADISIMKYVGATDWYIRFPFIIEGSILGIIGSVVAILLIRNLYYYLYGLIQNSISVLPLGTTIAPPEYVMVQIGVYFIIYGIFLGAIGSMFSLRKFLHV